MLMAGSGSTFGSAATRALAGQALGPCAAHEAFGKCQQPLGHLRSEGSAVLSALSTLELSWIVFRVCSWCSVRFWRMLGGVLVGVQGERRARGECCPPARGVRQRQRLAA